MRTLILPLLLCTTISASADKLCDWLGSPCDARDRAAEERVRDARRAADDAFRDTQQRIDMERHDLDQWSINSLDRRLPRMPPPLRR
jgi:hypothetical protein